MRQLLILTLLLQISPPAARPFRSGEGYAADRASIEAVIRQSRESPVPGSSDAAPPGSPMLAGVCPHDDHALAGPVVLPVMEQVRAPRILLLGVAHKAWKWNVKGALIFDDFTEWMGPLGPLRVDTGLREALKKALPADACLVGSAFHEEEHSLAALVPFIQFFDPGAEIVPILVPYMPWPRMEALAGTLAGAAAAIMREKGWVLGPDVQVLISNDAVHYGDQGWGGKNHAPYGVGVEGLINAKANDRRLIESYLAGPIEPGRLRNLLHELVEEKDLTTYKVTWCGRFAIPFGLEFTRRLAEKMGLPAPEGKLLAYSTSVELGQLEVKALPPTAPSNLRHWVGYAAMGWWTPEARP